MRRSTFASIATMFRLGTFGDSPRRFKISTAILCTFAAIAALSPEISRADLITQSSEIIEQTYNSSGFGGAFLQFDQSLGVLKSVSLSFSGTITFYANFIQDPSCSQNCNDEFGFSTGYSFNAPGFPVTNPGLSADFFTTANWQGTAVAPDLTMQSEAEAFAYTAFSNNLIDYIGTGTISVYGGISEDSDFSQSEGARALLSDNLDLVTSLTYDYLPVPEPSVLVLLSTGLFGLYLARRRRGVPPG